MQRFALLAVAGLVWVAPSALAQAAPATQDAFGFCTVTDTGHTPARIWASPVFAFAHRSDDAGGFARLQVIAGQFLEQVTALGGAGNKQCQGDPTREGAQAARQEQQAIWDRRMYFVKIGDWREVPWQPAAWTPAMDTAPPAQLTRYFYCYTAQLDVPDRSDRSRTVSSRVFARPVPGNDPVAAYTLATVYQEDFKGVAQAHGLPAQGTLCLPFDTQGEAQKSLADNRKLLDGFNQKYTEIEWQPDAAAMLSTPLTRPLPTATPAPAPAPAPAPEVTRATAPVAPAVDPARAETPAAPAGDAALYCTASVSRSKPSLNVRAPIQQQADASTAPERLAATLEAYARSVSRAYDAKWFEWEPAKCYENASVFAGESFCFIGKYKHFGGSQQAALFCNASRERLQARWENLNQSDGGTAQVHAWP